ncbi:MAG: hypothetical protein ACI9WT_002361 [Flavobacterium sp.]|jgi:hypothetical protein
MSLINILAICFIKMNLNPIVMSRMIYDYTKEVLERVSFNTELFIKELKKAIRNLLPYEIDHLRKWLLFFTNEKPELKGCLAVIA